VILWKAWLAGNVGRTFPVVRVRLRFKVALRTFEIPLMSKFDGGFIKVIGTATEGDASPPPRSVAARATKSGKSCSWWKRGWQELHHQYACTRRGS
jgi:hypothetical protein